MYLVKRWGLYIGFEIHLPQFRVIEQPEAFTLDTAMRYCGCTDSIDQ